MVIKVISKYDVDPPADPEAGNRRISAGPLYSQHEVMGACNDCRLLTRKSKNNAADLGLEKSDVIDLIKMAVTNGRYLNSEWCATGSNNCIAACDAYKVAYRVYNKETDRYMNWDCYLKFAVNKNGQLLLVVSVHSS